MRQTQQLVGLSIGRRHEDEMAILTGAQRKQNR
jgi:hypothetical protein